MIPKNRAPTHPGRILQDEFLAPAGITQTAFAKHLGGTWTQAKVSEIVRGRRGVTEKVALDFADAFDTSARFWLNLQNQYDLWHARQQHTPVQKIVPLKIDEDPGIDETSALEG